MQNVALNSKSEFNLSIDEPLYILNNEDFAVKFRIENNENYQQIINFTKPSRFSVTVPANGVKTYKLILNRNSVPFQIEATNQKGEIAGKLDINPLLVKPGIQVENGTSGFVSSNSNNFSQNVLAHKETLP